MGHDSGRLHSAAVHLAASDYAIACTAIVVGALVQGSIGFGINLLAAPIIAIVHPQALPAALVILALPLSATTALREHHAIDRPAVRWMMLGAVPGTAVGLVVVRTVSVDVLAVVVGIVAIVGVGISIVSRPIAVRASSALVAGFAAAAMGTAASVGGPPVALLYQHHDGPTVRSTLGSYFALAGVLTVAGLIAVGKVHGEQLVFAAALLPPMLIGLWLSRHFHALVDRGWMRPAVLALSGAAGLAAVVHGVT